MMNGAVMNGAVMNGAVSICLKDNFRDKHLFSKTRVRRGVIMIDELENDDDVRVDINECKTCKSVWRPTRRNVLQAAAAVVAAGVLVGNADSADAKPVLIDCDAEHLQCYQDAQTAHDISDADCLANETGLAQILCRMKANGDHARAVAACEVEYRACVALMVAAAMAQAAVEALQWILVHPIEAVIGAIIIIGGIALLIIACPPPATGLCVAVICSAVAA
ncbi:MAG: twin-arginine translocation signal domain-containing protein [Armatimonadetes bacterium]|nr:twin-arginine translocation signal domain-containing protein [Armatimonadota bacterium]